MLHLFEHQSSQYSMSCNSFQSVYFHQGNLFVCLLVSLSFYCCYLKPFNLSLFVSLALNLSLPLKNFVSLRLTLFFFFLPTGRVRTRRQSSGSAVSASSTVTDSRGRSRAKVVSQSQRKCLCRALIPSFTCYTQQKILVWYDL